MLKRIRGIGLIIYHGIQYAMTFLVLLIAFRHLVIFLYSGNGFLVLAVLSGFITFRCYEPGDRPWWWIMIKRH